MARNNNTMPAVLLALTSSLFLSALPSAAAGGKWPAAEWRGEGVQGLPASRGWASLVQAYARGAAAAEAAAASPVAPWQRRTSALRSRILQGGGGAGAGCPNAGVVGAACSTASAASYACTTLASGPSNLTCILTGPAPTRRVQGTETSTQTGGGGGGGGGGVPSSWGPGTGGAGGGQPATEVWQGTCGPLGGALTPWGATCTSDLDCQANLPFVVTTQSMMMLVGVLVSSISGMSMPMAPPQAMECASDRHVCTPLQDAPPSDSPVSTPAVAYATVGSPCAADADCSPPPPPGGGPAPAVYATCSAASGTCVRTGAAGDAACYAGQCGAVDYCGHAGTRVPVPVDGVTVGVCLPRGAAGASCGYPDTGMASDIPCTTGFGCDLGSRVCTRLGSLPNGAQLTLPDAPVTVPNDIVFMLAAAQASMFGGLFCSSRVAAPVTSPSGLWNVSAATCVDAATANAGASLVGQPCGCMAAGYGRPGTLVYCSMDMPGGACTWKQGAPTGPDLVAAFTAVQACGEAAASAGGARSAASGRQCTWDVAVEVAAAFPSCLALACAAEASVLQAELMTPMLVTTMTTTLATLQAAHIAAPQCVVGIATATRTTLATPASRRALADAVAAQYCEMPPVLAAHGWQCGLTAVAPSVVPSPTPAASGGGAGGGGAAGSGGEGHGELDDGRMGNGPSWMAILLGVAVAGAAVAGGVWYLRRRRALGASSGVPSVPTIARLPRRAPYHDLDAGTEPHSGPGSAVEPAATSASAEEDETRGVELPPLK